MPARSYSRLKKGGNSLSVPDELNDLENSLKSIKSDVDLALEKIKSLGEKIQSKEEKEEVEVKENTEEEKKEENEEVEEEENEEENEEEKEEETDTDEEPEEVKEEIKLDDQSISIDGFDGTVKQLKDSMRKKAGQLSKNKNYKDKTDSINASLNKIKNAKNSNDVEEIVTSNTSLTFKNNSLMGGKKTVSHKKRKARRSRKKH